MKSKTSIRRVYLVVWWFDRLGGMERHVTELALALAGAGVEVVVFSEQPVPRSNAYGQRLRSAGVRLEEPGVLRGLARRIERGRYWTAGVILRWFHRVGGELRWRLSRSGPSEPWTYAQQAVQQRADYNLLTQWILGRLTRYAVHAPPDVVHIHGCCLGQDWIVQWAQAFGFPSVYTEHTTIADWADTKGRAQAAEIVCGANLLSCVSESARASLQAVLPAPRPCALTRHIVRALPQGSNGARLTALLCVARLARHKGIDVLLDAMAILRDRGLTLALTVAGDGDERAALESQAERLGISQSVRFLGAVDHESIGGLWDSAGIGVLPSRTEGLPLSVVEAMAHGKPIVATTAGGIPEVIRHDENGLLVGVDDPAGMAGALARILTEPGLASRLGASARRAFETGGWSEEDVTRHTLSLYEQARGGLARNSNWIRERTREAIDGIRRVYLVSWSMNPFGDMEHAIAQQASALADAGVEVVVLMDRAPSLTNRYLFRMRRAGVRILLPSRIGFPVSRLFEKIVAGTGGTWSAESYAANALLRESMVRPADAIQIHGWRSSARWSVMPAALGLARQLGIPLVYTEHYEPADAGPGEYPDRPEFADVWFASAASPASRDFLAAATGGRTVPGVMRHLAPLRPEPPQPSNRATFRVLAFPASTDEAIQFRQQFEMARQQSAGMELTFAIQERGSQDIAELLSDCDTALISESAEGHAVVMAEAMALYKPVIFCGDPEPTPLRHRANSLAATLHTPGSVAGAILELAGDPLLAHALGLAARRSFESSGCCELAIAAQSAAVCRSARAQCVTLEGCTDNARC